MPSPVAHTLGAYSVLLLLHPKFIQSRYMNSLALGSAFFFGSLADADFVVAQFSSARYLQHHFFSHSIPFAIVIGLLCYGIAAAANIQQKARTAFLLFSAYTSHLLLDYMTEDGSKPYGIPLLWPFTEEHFVSPLMLFYSIHRGQWHDIFGPHNLLALIVEIAITGPLALLAYVMARNRLSRGKTSG